LRDAPARIENSIALASWAASASTSSTSIATTSKEATRLLLQPAAHQLPIASCRR
jgi:hypothetical protein